MDAKITKKRKSNDYIEPKNYIYAVLVFVGIILVVLYIFSWYNVKKSEKLMESYLISTRTIESSIKDINSLEQITQEAPSSYFIYLGYTNDEDVYNLEVSLKKIIDKYKINDSFYYLDLTEMKENNSNYLSDVASSLKVDNINNIPAIIYVNEGQIVDVLDGNNNTLLQAKDFEQLLNNYDFELIK